MILPSIHSASLIPIACRISLQTNIKFILTSKLVNLNTVRSGFHMIPFTSAIVNVGIGNLTTAQTDIHARPAATHTVISKFKVFVFDHGMMATEIFGVGIAAYRTSVGVVTAVIAGCTVHLEGIFVVMRRIIGDVQMMIELFLIQEINRMGDFLVGAVFILFGDLNPSVFDRAAIVALVSLNTIFGGSLMIPVTIVILRITTGDLIAAQANVHIAVAATHAERVELNFNVLGVMSAEGFIVARSTILTSVANGMMFRTKVSSTTTLCARRVA